MRLHNLAYMPTQVASAFVNIESYTRETNLIISQAEGDPTFIGRAYEMSPLTGGGTEFSKLIQNVAKLAPDNSLIQASLMSVPDYDTPYTLVKGKTHGNAALTELIHRQAKLYEKALTVGALHDLPALNKKTLVVSLMIPVQSANDAALDNTLQVQTEFLNRLKGGDFSDAHHLSPGELLGVYRQFSNIYAPRRIVPVDDMISLRQQAYGPDDRFDFRNSDFALFQKSIYCTMVVPKSLPAVVDHGLMNLVIGAPLNAGTAKEGGGERVKTPFIITATIRVADQRKEADRVARAIKSREHTDKLPFQLGSEDTAETLKDLKGIQKACSESTNKYTYASLSCFVFSKNKDEMEAASSSFKMTLDNLNFDARPVSDTIGIRFAQALPLNFSPKIAAKLENEALMPAGAAACLVPIFGDYQGNANLRSSRTGSVFLTRRGSAYHFDPYATTGNKNGILAAQSAVGKSYVLQYMIANDLAEGSRVYLFDNGRSSKKFCDVAGGEYIDFNLRNPNKPSLNPLWGLSELEFDEQAETISELILQMAYYKEEMDSGARIAIQESVKAAHGSKGKKSDIEAVIDSLAILAEATAEISNPNEVVIAARNLIPRLRSFMNSPSRGPFFQGQSSFDPKNPFTVFELSALDGDPHLKQCVLFFIMNTLMTSIKVLPGRKKILVDEASEVIQVPAAAKVMEGLYRKASKDEASIWIFTQSMCDAAQSATGQVILSQSQWKLVMQQQPDEIQRAVKNGIMTKFEKDAFFGRLIEDIKTERGVYSEILICGQDGYEAVRLYVDRFADALFSTEPQFRKPIFDLMAQGVDAVDAINLILGDTKTKRTKWLKEIIGQLRKFENLSDTEIRNEIDEALDA